MDGMIKFWDPRFSESVRNLEADAGQMTSFEVHTAANVLARFEDCNIRLHNGLPLKFLLYGQMFIDRFHVSNVFSI
jgi:hypothetical protein